MGHRDIAASCHRLSPIAEVIGAATLEIRLVSVVSINVGNLFHKGPNGQTSTHGETHRPLDFALFKRYVAEDKRRTKTPGENPTLSASISYN